MVVVSFNFICTEGTWHMVCMVGRRLLYRMRSSRRILWYAVGFITITLNVSTLCCHAIEVFTRNARDTQSRLMQYLERTTQRLHNSNYLLAM